VQNFTFYNFFFFNFDLIFSKLNILYTFSNYSFFHNFEKLLISNFDVEQVRLSRKSSFFEKEYIFQNYLSLKTSSFIDFFSTNMIDVPICFKKSKSLKLKNFELFFLKFINLFMRNGQKEKAIRLLLNSF
jgi:hypothetical protein